MKKGFSLVEVLVSLLLLNISIYLSLEIHNLSKQMEIKSKEKMEQLFQEVSVLDSLTLKKNPCKETVVKKEFVEIQIKPLPGQIPFVKASGSKKTSLWRLIPCTFENSALP